MNSTRIFDSEALRQHILIAVDVAIAAAIIWKTEDFEMHKKRNTTQISSSTREAISFKLVGEISQVNPLQKRDSAVNHNFIQFNTTFGVHIAVSSVLSIEELAKHILVAELEWYNYEGGNFDSLLEDAVQDALGKYPDWKYCVAPNDLKRGEATNYQDNPGVGTGTGNVMHDEVYFNTYGVGRSAKSCSIEMFQLNKILMMLPDKKIKASISSVFMKSQKSIGSNSDVIELLSE
ncbi:hypothetical protein RI543_002052 [Arxiozyma heterogenica]|uniref:Uncharacterized protein n=1 Tax=Arxiozyma heterogenica TaxID=278026 RepID=A0AAN7WN43_9SACH|nr:hypothetical protein RI543_002052 [Kazachstania heterogenica]